jgi:anti-anti-sigma factor
MNAADHQCVHLTIDWQNCGALEENALSQVRETLESSVDMGQSGPFVVDVRHVEVPSAALIGTLLETRKHLRDEGRVMQLCNVGHTLMDVLTTCKLSTLFDVAPQQAPKGGEPCPCQLV